MALSNRRAPSCATLNALSDALSAFRLSNFSATQIGRRHASHQAQGRANGAKDGPGKRLGAKKAGGEYVVPGNILFKQRGTLWYPGENAMMGRDHTIHATAPGFVRYYRDPARHPKRKYIGISLNKSHQLPTPPNAITRRKLGMLAYQVPQTITEIDTGDLMTGSELSASASSTKLDAQPSTIREAPNTRRSTVTMFTNPVSTGGQKTALDGSITLRPGYQYRQANWYIGRAAERSAKAMKVKPFQPGDRFAAWRRLNARKAANVERRAMKRGGKKK
ncbi:hypothetical protein K431DRAFT_346604 [Polychaeton citri CBS 116435]|uniref:Large ribosomal subunit protein bL27m n=1 Tax=Polychaeton citri CBS 116435 TaxID=1314669 RepID=A0A9P4QAI8_9PEZI|nr:hypothetical protein K431DRAFT_346604 [Polychaeton citri CBS 116435]